MGWGAVSGKSLVDVSHIDWISRREKMNSSRYFLRLLGWARKYGLRVCLDLHTVPGSQNSVWWCIRILIDADLVFL